MSCEIKSHRIYRKGKQVGYQPTLNAGGMITPTIIVLHDTAGDLSGRGSITWLRGGPGGSPNSSAHVVIGRDGAITQLAPTNVRTWHAGESSWRGRKLLNGCSIGIEIANPGGPLRHDGGGRYKGAVTIDTIADPTLVVRRGAFPIRTEDGKPMVPTDGLWLDYSPEQIDAVVDLCRALVAAYPTITEIVTHWMIAPNRKVDTNPLFPLDEVRRRVFGASVSKPQPLLAVPTEAPTALVSYVQEMLRGLGYFEVGRIDGDYKSRARGAVLAFRADHGLPLTTEIDDQLLEALTRAKPREVSPARAAATAATLRKAVPAVQQAGRSKMLAWLLGAPSAAVAAVQGVADHVELVKEQLAPLQELLGTVPVWAWALLVIAVAFGVWWSSRKAEAATVEAYRTGRLS